MENRHLFRGKRIDNGEWVEGYCAKGLDMYDKEIHIIFEFATIFYSSGETDGFVEVDPSTICQCTGYEGIYEKDIFTDEGGIFVIKWSDDLLEWIVKDIFGNEEMSLCNFLPEYINVIGNEIDNPELLEV